nr:hypothetical protein [Chloroflexia bacterium]
MDHEKFDALARAFAPVTSRRTLLRRAGIAGVVAAFGRATSTAASHCKYIGCGCAAGARHQCVAGLVCCESSPGTPGGAGTCQLPGDCGPAAPCTGVGCYCAAGTYEPCDGGLVCCADDPGLPGSSGTCQFDCGPRPCT